MHNTPILQVENLSFSYPERPLFNNMSFDVPSGITVVRGGDGCGKTSLLRLLAANLAATGGQLRIRGVSLHEQLRAYQQEVFWIEPDTEAFDQMTVADYFTSLKKTYARFDESLLPGLSQGLALGPHLHKQLFMLSTGSKRKVWLAAAFAAGATLNLLDDPFAALDKASIQFVKEMLSNVAGNAAQAWVIAMYAAPVDMDLSALVDLGDG